LQQLADAVTTSDAHLFDVRPTTAWAEDTMLARGLGGAKHFRGQNPAGGAAIGYFLKAAPAGDVKITISDTAGRVVRELNGTKDAGINRVQWNLTPNPPPAPEGAEGRGGRGGGRGGRGGRGGGPTFIAPDNAVDPGTYIVKLSVGGRDLMKTLLVEADSVR
jgi:hypothetical protein